MKKYGPFGEGCQRPVFLVKNFDLTPNKFNPEGTMLMGDNKSHIKFFSDNYAAVAFNQAEEYEIMGKPKSLDLVGSIDENFYKNKRTPQFKIEIMDVAEKLKEQTKEEISNPDTSR